MNLQLDAYRYSYDAWLLHAAHIARKIGWKPPIKHVCSINELFTQSQQFRPASLETANVNFAPWLKALFLVSNIVGPNTWSHSELVSNIIVLMFPHSWAWFLTIFIVQLNAFACHDVDATVACMSNSQNVVPRPLLHANASKSCTAHYQFVGCRHSPYASLGVPSTILSAVPSTRDRWMLHMLGKNYYHLLGSLQGFMQAHHHTEVPTVHKPLAPRNGTNHALSQYGNGVWWKCWGVIALQTFTDLPFLSGIDGWSSPTLWARPLKYCCQNRKTTEHHRSP